MRVDFRGAPARGVTAKDLILALIGKLGTAGGMGYAVEYAGEAIRGLDMEGRMTVCNLSIELGAKVGMVAPDDKTYAFLKGRRHAPKGAQLGRRPSRTGRRCPPTPARSSTARRRWTARRSRRRSPGAPAPRT